VRVLYVCHRFPYPPSRGGKIRPFNMVRHLSENHEVTLCSLARSPSEAAEARGIAPYCARHFVEQVDSAIQSLRMLARVPTLTPSSLGYFYSPALSRRIDDLLRHERFDLIFVHCSSVAQYVVGHSKTPKILDFGDMDSQKWLEYARYKPFPICLGYRLEGTKMVAEEKRMAGSFDLCTATTRAEWQTLESYDTGTPTDWFPNGVDAEYFAPDGAPYDPDMISFVGRMDYYPNQQCMLKFCTTTFPRLRLRRPTLRLFIVGADPSPAVRRLGKMPGITITGSVPDVRPYLRRSALMVAPLEIARGTQNKLLEAMACGIPVVTSAIAAGGIDALPGEHMLIAGTPDEYETAILSLLNRPDERARLSRSGRGRMLTHHDWKQSMRKLDMIIDRCLAGDERARLRSARQRHRSTPSHIAAGTHQPKT
jgi:sugar transferase (PEP-CTERM/EpsH1 system associated)